MTVQYLGMSFIAALAASISVYAETGSFLFAFLAYAGAGTIVLLSVIASTALTLRAEDSDMDDVYAA